MQLDVARVASAMISSRVRNCSTNSINKYLAVQLFGSCSECLRGEKKMPGHILLEKNRMQNSVFNLNAQVLVLFFRFGGCFHSARVLNKKFTTYTLKGHNYRRFDFTLTLVPTICIPLT